MSNLEQRLAALEAQNSALRERIDELEGGAARRGPAPGPSSVEVATDDAPVGRRDLLLFAASAAVAPQPSLAATDDPILAGNTTTANVNNITIVEGSDDGSISYPREAMRINNTGLGPALRVANTGGTGTAPLTIEVASNGGSFGDTGGLATDGNDTYSDLLYFHSGSNEKTGSDAIVGKVLTTNFAQFVDFPAGFPTRAVETRAAQGVKNHPNSSGSLSSGTYTVDISSLLPDGTSGIFASITTVPQNNAPGFLRFWAEGDEPDTSNLAWSGGQIETTSAVTAVTSSGTFQVAISGDVHLVVDLVGVIKND